MDKAIKYNCQATLSAIHQLKFQGDITPAIWYQKIRLRTRNAPDLLAIAILARIVYWYRPIEVRDEQTGEVMGLKKKFKADMLQLSLGSLAQQFGCSKRQASEAIKRLCDDYQLLTKELRQIDTPLGKISNVLFIAPCVDTLAALQQGIEIIDDSMDTPSNELVSLEKSYKNIPLSPSIPKISKGEINLRQTECGAGGGVVQKPAPPTAKTCSTYCKNLHGVLQKNVPPPPENGGTYTKTTTKNTTKTTTKSASNSELSTVSIIHTNKGWNAAAIKNELNRCQHAMTDRDRLITSTLTVRQRDYLAGLAMLFAIQDPQFSASGWQRQLESVLLDPTRYTQAGRDFIKKCNTMFRVLRSGQWHPPLPKLTVVQTREGEQVRSVTEIQYQNELAQCESELINCQKLIELFSLHTGEGHHLQPDIVKRLQDLKSQQHTLKIKAQLLKKKIDSLTTQGDHHEG